MGLSFAVAGCSNESTAPPDSLRFGQVGDVVAHLAVPLRGGVGALDQTLEWTSNGAWSLKEVISYKGQVGDEQITRSPSTPALAKDYATANMNLDETEGLQLDIPQLPQTLDPECGPVLTRVTFTIHDGPKDEDRSWTRCAIGALDTLNSLSTLGAGPDQDASRVAAAALLASKSTLGPSFASAYSGSVPFATLDRGEDTPANLTAPFAITDQTAWAVFWHQHTAGKGYPPMVDFSREMVIVAAAGKRSEAGDSIEVHRILQVGQGTLVQIWERVPGDYCSPVARVHTPYHIVVAPLTALPIQFGEIHTEQVPCGAQGG